MKKVVAQVKLQIPAGSANPQPPVGPALGQHDLAVAGRINLVDRMLHRFRRGKLPLFYVDGLSCTTGRHQKIRLTT